MAVRSCVTPSKQGVNFPPLEEAKGKTLENQMDGSQVGAGIGLLEGEEAFQGCKEAFQELGESKVHW